MPGQRANHRSRGGELQPGRHREGPRRAAWDERDSIGRMVPGELGQDHFARGRRAYLAHRANPKGVPGGEGQVALAVGRWPLAVGRWPLETNKRKREAYASL